LEYLFVAHIREHVMYDDKHEPINDRAWTFQEQLLSPRLLIYASHTLQWQCRTLTCNMGGSYHSPNPSAAPRLPPKEMLLPQYIGNLPEREHPSLEYGAEIPHLTLQHWLRIVTSYSTRKSLSPRSRSPTQMSLARSTSPGSGPGPRYSNSAGAVQTDAVFSRDHCSIGRLLGHGPPSTDKSTSRRSSKETIPASVCPIALSRASPGTPILKPRGLTMVR